MQEAPDDGERADGERGVSDEESTLDGCRSKFDVAVEHGFRWSTEDTCADQLFSVRDAIARVGRKVPTSYLKEASLALRPGVTIPSNKFTRMELPWIWNWNHLCLNGVAGLSGIWQLLL